MMNRLLLALLVFGLTSIFSTRVWAQEGAYASMGNSLLGTSFQLQVCESLDVQSSSPNAPMDAVQRSSEEVERERNLARRREIAGIHRAFGAATWLAMAATTTLGLIHFGDRYGFHGNESDTACARGSAVFQDACSGFPAVYAIPAFVTLGLYATASTLSFMMPAPMAVSSDLEIHRALRWVHMGGMIAQIALGILAVSLDTDFQTRQGLAGAQQVAAIVTYGALSTAAAVILF